MIVHGELADHLAPKRVSGRFDVDIELPTGLRDLVQSCGIPHVEVGHRHLEGVDSPWGARVDGGAMVELWPAYPADDPEPDPRFLLDVHLGKLARILRLLGFDASYANRADDDQLAAAAAAERRILLSRDRGLLMRGVVARGRWIRETDPEAQAAEVIRSFALGESTVPFTRCMDCNGVLERADPSTVEVPPAVADRHAEYRRCPDCRRVYWPGSHHPGLERTIERILGR